MGKTTIKKTKFASYCLNGLPRGCKFCVKGRKLVLFVTGICQRNCFYCSLSEKRKNKDDIWVNERKCKNVRDMIEEAKESNVCGAGITGGDPFLKLQRTLEFAKALKKKFKHFHIHIYLPTKFLTKEKLRKLKRVVDEVRFHPEFLTRKLSEKEVKKELEKIKLANLFWKKENIGIELPILPDKKKEIFNFILKIKNYIGFVNLNEVEISDTNFNYITKNYKLKEKGYVVVGSKEAGLWILKKCKEAKIKLKIHLCTAETKNWFQYKNRLLCHKILPFGKRTEEGTVVYFAIYCKNKKELRNIERKLKVKKIYVDNKKKRVILAKDLVKNLIKKYKIYKVEEYPTYDGVEVESERVQTNRRAKLANRTGSRGGERGGEI